MAKARDTRAQTPTKAGLSAEELGYVEEEESLDAALDRVVTELGGDDDVSISLYRIVKGERQEGFIDSYPPSDFEGELSFLKRIRDEHGGGEYRIQIRDGKHFRVNRRVKIEGGAPKVAHVEEPQGLAAIIEAGNKRLEQLIASLVSAVRPPETEETFIRRMAMMKQLFAPSAPATPQFDAADTVKQLMDTFRQGLALGKEINPAVGAEPEDVLLETVKTLGPELIRQVQRIGNTEDQLRAAQIHRPAAATPKVQNQVAQAEVRKFVGLLVNAAALNSDVSLYAEMVYDQVGETALKDLFAKGDPVELLAILDPHVKEHTQWFTQLRDELAAIMREEADATARGANAPPAGPVGDLSDLASHEGDDVAGAEES